MICSCKVSVLIILTLLVREESIPTQYPSSFHHGVPKLFAQSERGKGGGM